MPMQIIIYSPSQKIIFDQDWKDLNTHTQNVTNLNGEGVNEKLCT